MKRVVSLMLITATIGITSCKKELVSGDSLDTSQTLSASTTSDATASGSKFGVLPNGLNGDDKITVAQKLGLGYARDAVVLTDFDGKAPMLNKWQENGYKVLVNVNYDQQDHFSNGDKKPRPFPTDMDQYKRLLKNFLDKYSPEVAVIENEPFNDNHYKGPIDDYFTELSTAIDVCHNRGIKVADGGLNPQRVRILVYQHYVNQGKQSKADDFAKRALTDQDLRIANGDASADAENKLDETRKMVKKYKHLNLDYVNIHWYEPIKDDIDQTVTSDGVLQEVADYLRDQTGHPVITNEFGQNNHHPSLVSSQVDAFRSANFKYAIDWSGHGASGAVPLTNGTDLKPNGKSYRDRVAK